jgi:hypothetical protein
MADSLPDRRFRASDSTERAVTEASVGGAGADFGRTAAGAEHCAGSQERGSIRLIWSR